MLALTRFWCSLQDSEKLGDGRSMGKFFLTKVNYNQPLHLVVIRLLSARISKGLIKVSTFCYLLRP